jgi:hypothetical protein
MPAGGEPLESAKIVSMGPWRWADVGVGLVAVCPLARLARAFHEVLEHLEPHLPHRRELAGIFLQLLGVAGTLHRLGEGVDIDRVGLLDIGQAHEAARLLGRAVDLDVDLHQPCLSRARERAWVSGASEA